MAVCICVSIHFTALIPEAMTQTKLFHKRNPLFLSVTVLWLAGIIVDGHQQHVHVLIFDLALTVYTTIAIHILLTTSTSF